MANLQSIDELILGDFHYLDSSDICYFYLIYHAKKGYTFSEYNQLIGNFKKKLERKNMPDWKYKQLAISRIGAILRQTFSEIKTPVTIIPIPPSKCKTDPMYDDRMIKALEIATEGLKNVFLKDLIQLKDSREASHASTDSRLTPLQLSNLLKLDDLNDIETNEIILVDDVITTGSQFKACKNLILSEYKNVNITGLFIARTQHDNSIDDFNDEDDFDWLR